VKVEKEIAACRDLIREVQRKGGTVGVVPTMGALHEGHLSLVRKARSECSFVAVTIFVNPTQFAPGEDFENYPRPIETDLQLCESAGVDLVFLPSVQAMYPGDERTSIHVRELTEGLCGAHRVGHFDGVATVVAKLFHILPANKAYFGEKDYQQLVMIRRMVRDLSVPVEIVPCPTVRESDCLAMSSRNAYLSAEHRFQARSLSRALLTAAESVRGGEREASAITERIRREIHDAGPCKIEYVDVVDAETLRVLDRIDRPVRICLAVRIGATR
jgi:pantoate--beta-alanine ligase